MIRTILKPLSFIPALLLMYMIFPFPVRQATYPHSSAIKSAIK